MVDIRAGNGRTSTWAVGRRRLGIWAVLLATVTVALLVVIAGQGGSATSAAASVAKATITARVHVGTPSNAPVAIPAPATRATPVQTPATPVAADAPEVATAPQPTVATLVAQVEAAGIVPGATGKRGGEPVPARRLR